jgi:hypothetical protein
MWPTPVANDAKNGTLPKASEMRDSLPGALRRAQLQGNLNPDWVECLMGFPPGWTDIDGLPDLDTPSTHGNLQESPLTNNPIEHPD